MSLHLILCSFVLLPLIHEMLSPKSRSVIVKSMLLRNDNRRKAIFSLHHSNTRSETIIKSLNSTSMIECSANCLGLTGCTGYNIHRENKTCQPTESNTELHDAAGWDFYMAEKSDTTVSIIANKAGDKCFIPSSKNCSFENKEEMVTIGYGSECNQVYAYFKYDIDEGRLFHNCSNLEFCAIYKFSSIPKLQPRIGHCPYPDAWVLTKVNGLSLTTNCFNITSTTDVDFPVIGLEETCENQDLYYLPSYENPDKTITDWVYLYQESDISRDVYRINSSAQIDGSTTYFWQDDDDIILTYHMDQIVYFFMYSFAKSKWNIREMTAHGKFGSLISEGLWAETYSVFCTFYIRSKPFIFAQSASSKEWVVYKLPEGGSVGDMVSSGSWSLYYNIQFSFVISGKIYLYGYSRDNKGWVVNTVNPEDISISSVSSGFWTYDYVTQVHYTIKGRHFIYFYEDNAPDYPYEIREIIEDGYVSEILFSGNLQQRFNVKQFPVMINGQQHLYLYDTENKKWYLKVFSYDGQLQDTVSEGESETPFVLNLSA